MKRATAHRIGIFAIAAAAWAPLDGTASAASDEGTKILRLAIPEGKLRASVAPAHGADLAGLQVERDGKWTELLYHGDDYSPTVGTDWSGKAPILWPAVGRTYVRPPGSGQERTDAGWLFRGKKYPMPIHGFARDQPWKIVSNGACDHSAYVVLALEDTAETRQVYPFGFALTTEYRISGDGLYIRQSVRAAPSNTEAMPFSVGNHITFRLPLSPGSTAGETSIATPATRQIITDEFGIPTGQVDAGDFAKSRLLSSFLPLTATSLSGYADGPAWVRLTDPSGFTILVSHSEDSRPAHNPVLFNLWGDVGHGFFAPEPWVGKQDSLATGDGVIALEPGKSFHWTIAVQVSNGAGSNAVPNAPSCRQAGAD
jgi:galactose mutarotase-like enzyme